MQNAVLVSALVLVAVAVLNAPKAVDAVCCPADKSSSGRGLCGDCTSSTPYCGYGSCNIFGCNCRGGCRSGTCSSKRSVVDEFTSAESILSAGDSNGDGVLSFEEAETLLEQRHGPSAVHRRSVRSLDKNLDGLLSADEID